MAPRRRERPRRWPPAPTSSAPRSRSSTGSRRCWDRARKPTGPRRRTSTRGRARCSWASPAARSAAPPPDAPAAAVPALAAAQPLAGRRLALLGDPAAFASVVPGRRAAQRRHELGALRPRAPRCAGRRGRRRGRSPPVRSPGTMPSWWPTARRRRSRPRRWRRSPPSSRAAGPSSAGARVASPWRAPPASRRRRSPRARRRPGSRARRSRWEAAWWSTTTTRSSPAGTSSADYGAVLSGWTLGSPAGRPAILDERVGAGHAVLFAFDPGLPRLRARAPRRCSRLR